MTGQELLDKNMEQAGVIRALRKNTREDAETIERLTKERDEAREAIRTLAEHGESEIQRLTKERDEAREEASHWKVEFEIASARLREEKHPRDNGIFAPDEVIPKLQRVAEAARAVVHRWEQPSWKDTAPTAGFIYALRDALCDYYKK